MNCQLEWINFYSNLFFVLKKNCNIRQQHMFKLTEKDAKTLFDKDVKITDVILVRLLLTHLLQMLLSKPRKTLENLTPF